MMELVGLGYTAWFTYRYLLFKVREAGLADGRCAWRAFRGPAVCGVCAGQQRLTSNARAVICVDRALYLSGERVAGMLWQHLTRAVCARACVCAGHAT